MVFDGAVRVWVKVLVDDVYVNIFSSSPELVTIASGSPPVVTLTYTFPLPAGTVANIWVSLHEPEATVAVTVPNFTVPVSAPNPSPFIVTEVPATPLEGLIEVICGRSVAASQRVLFFFPKSLPYGSPS